MSIVELDTLKAWAQKAPVTYRAQYLRALRGKVTRSLAIKLKCLECCAWERKEDGIDKIGSCAVRRCPLWSVRPFQNATQSQQVAESAGELGRNDG